MSGLELPTGVSHCLLWSWDIFRRKTSRMADRVTTLVPYGLLARLGFAAMSDISRAMRTR